MILNIKRTNDFMVQNANYLALNELPCVKMYTLSTWSYMKS